MPVVKICCIASIEEAEMAIELGAGALGLVSRMPSGPGPIPLDRIGQIARHVGDRADTFLLTAETGAEGIVEEYLRAQTRTIQLVDATTPNTRDKVRARTGARIVQVVHVFGADSVREAQEAAVESDAVLLDSGNPRLPQKSLGGTGRVHDWDVSRAIVESLRVPVFLAGGLNAGNVGEAWRRVGPHGFDLCNGVRTDGALDPSKLGAFMDAVAGATREGRGRARQG